MLNKSQRHFRQFIEARMILQQKINVARYESKMMNLSSLVCHHGILSSILPLSSTLELGKIPIYHN